MLLATDTLPLRFRPKRPGFECDVPGCTGRATHWSARDDVRVCPPHSTDPAAVIAAAEAQAERDLDVAMDGAAAFAEFAGDPPPRGSCPYFSTIKPMLDRLDTPDWLEPRHVEALMRVEWGTLDARPLSDFRRYARIAAASTDEDRGLLDDLAESYGF